MVPDPPLDNLALIVPPFLSGGKVELYVSFSLSNAVEGKLKFNLVLDSDFLA